MKHLFFIASIICSLNCFSQNPDPQLFQTWYLSTVDFNSSLGYSVSDINPPITATLNFSITPSIPQFTGSGACNTFTGGFISSLAIDGLFQTAYFIPTTTVCSAEIHNSFETSYFEILRNASQYQIFQLSTGPLLMIINPIFGMATYRNFPLKTTEFDREKIAIYPNPSKSIFFLNSNQIAILNVNVINSFGQIVKTINDNFEAINISDLSSGIYMLKIDTELGTINKKIIKE
jgi:heat shock protein HslJ